MVKQNRTYQQSFANSLNKYTKKSRNRHGYRRKIFADRLVNYIVDDLIRDVITKPYDEMRIDALIKLGRWGKGEKEIPVLRRIVSRDPNLKVRNAAKNALNKIMKRNI